MDTPATVVASSTLCDRAFAGTTDDALRVSNVLLVSRLVINGLLSSAMQSKSRTLPPNHIQLNDLFVVLERVFKHGFKISKSVLSIRSLDDYLWLLIERLGKICKDAEESVTCIAQLGSVRSSIGKFRAWIRLAFMQKRLADYVNGLIDCKDLIKEFYEPSALFRDETSAVVFSGSLIGLRVIDCNLYLKEEDLNKQGYEIDLNLYVKVPTLPIHEYLSDENLEEISDDSIPSDESSWQIEPHLNTKDLKTVLDQKNYLEERNRYLTNRIGTLQQQLSILQSMSRHNSTPAEEIEWTEISKSEAQNAWHMQELETALASLEKDAHEKQDTIILLRSQIDDIKKINLDLYQKLRICEDNSKQKDKLIDRLEEEAKSVQGVLNDSDIAARDARAQLNKNELFLCTLKDELRQKTEFCAALQMELADLKNRSHSLEQSITAERIAREEIQLRLKTLQNIEKVYFGLKESHECLVQQLEEYEKTLTEMGVHLKESKLKADDYRETALTLADAKWEEDATLCKQCQKPFSVKNRKHHCRNCGQIFCNLCSENTMPLPSSSKPVRVCDSCYELLLKRFSAKNTLAQ